MVTLTQLSSLAKVFPKRIYGSPAGKGQCAKGTYHSYQLAIMGDKGEYTYGIASDLRDKIKVYAVGYVPSNLSAYPQAHDENYITTEPGLFPDPLYPVEGLYRLLSGIFFLFEKSKHR